MRGRDRLCYAGREKEGRAGGVEILSCYERGRRERREGEGETVSCCERGRREEEGKELCCVVLHWTTMRCTMLTCLILTTSNITR